LATITIIKKNFRAFSTFHILPRQLLSRNFKNQKKQILELFQVFFRVFFDFLHNSQVFFSSFGILCRASYRVETLKKTKHIFQQNIAAKKKI
jgi:hypothetical protein